MRKQVLLRVAIFFALIPLIFAFWEWGGAELVTNAIRPPAAVEAVRVGKPAPDFSWPPEDVWKQRPFRFAELKGRPVILHFWATWCGPCLLELPDLIQLADKLQPEGYQFVAVAVDESWSVLEKFFLQYPHLAPLREKMILLLDSQSEIANTFGSSKFPETLLINSELLIDNKFIGAQPWLDSGMLPYLENLRAPQSNTAKE
jgi:thiol-disulfide isomerase/thioredoxin